MSASREKKLRQDQTASGYVDPKAEKELEEKKAEKRSNVLYSVIAVLFVLVVAASFLWRSNVISRNATALTIDGETYNAAEVNFYYQNVYRGFLQSNSYFISYLGLDTNASLKSQTVNATAASMMGVEEGSSWHDYIMDNTVKQMTMVQRGLKQAQEEGYQFPASVQEQYEDSLNSLKTSAESTGMSVKAYLQRNLGAIMTEKVYNQQVLRMLQYQAYAQSYSDSLTYTDAELEAAYQADPKAYDKAAWEYVVVSGAADSTTDADGNTVQATDEEQAAAKEAAKFGEVNIVASSKDKNFTYIPDVNAIDYDKDARTTRLFFQTVQNKLHYAVHRHTAAELIVERADAAKEHMGLATWENAPDGKIVKADVTVAKNYLSEKEMSYLERIVSLYLDYAELQAERKIPMSMEDWAKRLDGFLEFNGNELLTGPGKISAEQAKLHAETEFEKYRIIQDRLYESDFDRFLMLEQSAENSVMEN